MTSALPETAPTAAKTRISIELVPRSLTHLRAELATLAQHFGGVDTVNIPDLLRFKTRSWQACAHAAGQVQRAIPHIRAIDIDPRRPLPMAEHLRQHGISEVLIVSGDPPEGMSSLVYNVTALDILRKFRRELPEIKLYAGLDPYRQSFAAERDYAEEKLEAGASGFFTQPFFDLRLMELYAELLPDAEIFWGVTTVMSERTLNYWRERNKAVLPRTFEPTLAWNRRLAADALQFSRERDQHIYYMPVTADLREYLEGII